MPAKDEENLETTENLYDMVRVNFQVYQKTF
jgi:hypothetical protein